MTKKYLFLTGVDDTVKEVEFDTDEQAVEAAKKDKSVIRVQCLETRNHIHEVVKKAEKVLLMLFLLAFGLSAQAATSIGVAPSPGGALINFANGGTNTQQSFINTNMTWPNNIPAGQSMTNVTAFDVSKGSHVAIQMNNQVSIAAAASVTNIVYHIGRSIQNNTITNALGTSCNIDWFATITNQLPASAAANTTYTSSALFGPVTGFSNGAGDGAMTTFYIGWIDPPANLAVTNSSVFVNSQ